MRGRDLSSFCGLGQVPWNVWMSCRPRSFFIGAWLEPGFAE